MPSRHPDHDHQHRALIDQIAALGPCLPGSITTRQMRCGRANCACKADPPKLHGPYTYWTRKEHGRTIARLLTPEQTNRYQPQTDNARRLRQLVTALEALATTTADTTEKWEAQIAIEKCGTSAEGGSRSKCERMTIDALGR